MTDKEINGAINNGSCKLKREPLRALERGEIFVISLLVAILVIAFASLQYYLPLASKCHQLSYSYNSTTLWVRKPLADGRVLLEFVVVSDLDHGSKHPEKKHTWQAYLRHGRFLYNPRHASVQVEWLESQGNNSDYTHMLFSQLSAGGRSMELSDLVVFDGHLLTVDDRTGVVYRINNFQDMVPWVILNDGPGNTTKGFKAEWATVKDNELYVGGLGKEWTTSKGEYVNYYPMWVKVISPLGEIRHLDWTEYYKSLRRAVGIEYPGYMIHESVQWSDIHQKWFFLPRRASKDVYTEEEDERRGANILLMASPDFTSIEVREAGLKSKDGARGFSAFQFLPGSNDDVIIALKSEEKNGIAVASYLFAFRLSDGRILLNDERLDGPYKFEGLAFV